MKKRHVVVGAFVLAAVGGALSVACSAPVEERTSTDAQRLGALPVSKTAKALGIKTWKSKARSRGDLMHLVAHTSQGTVGTVRVHDTTATTAAITIGERGKLTLEANRVSWSGMSEDDSKLFVAFMEGLAMVSPPPAADAPPAKAGSVSVKAYDQDGMWVPDDSPAAYTGSGSMSFGSDPYAAPGSSATLWEKCKGSTATGTTSGPEGSASLECLLYFWYWLRPVVGLPAKCDYSTQCPPGYGCSKSLYDIQYGYPGTCTPNGASGGGGGGSIGGGGGVPMCWEADCVQQYGSTASCMLGVCMFGTQ
ncbi:MAG: hypothetical protein JNL38_19615 [Myxococcales bacterium]|jgi:hypothetical protein|nr:hypothetical protein [Myxococcales bacterium]